MFIGSTQVTYAHELSTEWKKIYWRAAAQINACGFCEFEEFFYEHGLIVICFKLLCISMGT